MIGLYSGVQTRIKQISLASYVHCNAHILNLCLVDLAKQVPQVRNVFSTLSTLLNFIAASLKKQTIFEKMHSKLNVNTSDGSTTLKGLNDTRWSCWLDALKVIMINFKYVIDALNDISENDAVYEPEANSLKTLINTFEFLFCIHFFKKNYVNN